MKNNLIHQNLNISNNNKKYFNSKKRSKLSIILASAIVCSSILLSACSSGGGGSAGAGVNYYVPSPNYYYNVAVESSTTGISTATLLQENGVGTPIFQLNLTNTLDNPDVFKYTSLDGNTTAILKMKNGFLGFALNNISNTNQQYSDFAVATPTKTLRDGQYIAMCNVTGGYNPCIITYKDSTASIQQLYNNNGTMTLVTLCAGIPINSYNNQVISGLYSTSCGAGSPLMYVLPFETNGQPGVLINENAKKSVAGLDDGTDDIAFPLTTGATISPTGQYVFDYSANSSLGGIPQNGLSVATFSGTSVTNTVMSNGIPGGLIIMTPNSVFLGNYGFIPNLPINTLTVNSGQAVYNFVGNDVMGLYQDNFEGIYY